MEYAYKCEEQKLVVAFDGVMTADDSQKLQDITNTIGHTPTSHVVVFDMAGVTSVEADPLKLLLDMTSAIPASGHELYLANAPWLEKVLGDLNPDVELSQVS